MRRTFIEEEGAGDERRRQEHQRLNALLGYCEAATCRRQILLAYFGETSEPCGNCDLCLEPVTLEDGTADARAALMTVRLTGERFGAGHIVDILRGEATPKIEAGGHSRLVTFGHGANRRKTEWHSILRQLVTGNYLTIDPERFGGLRIAPKGEALLRGEAAFRFQPEPTRRKSRRDTADAGPASFEDQSLLTTLKAVRMRLAKERSVPAYVIFPDRTVIEMAQRRPSDETEFAEINGVGAAKPAISPPNSSPQSAPTRPIEHGRHARARAPRSEVRKARPGSPRRAAPPAPIDRAGGAKSWRASRHACPPSWAE